MSDDKFNAIDELATHKNKIQTSIKTIKLKDKVGMEGSKSTQTRSVGIITSTIHPYACFLSGCRNKLTGQ